VAIAIIRTVILYTAIIVALRIMGKRQIGELEPVEFVVAVLISDLAAHPLQDIGTPLLYGLIPVLTLLCCEVLISAAVVHSIRFRALVCGKPSLVIRQGRIVQHEMKKNRMTPDELSEQLRKNNIVDISTVKYGVLETDGSLSTLLYTDQSPLTPKQMGVRTDDIGYPIIVINDGKVLNNNLDKLGLNEKWLDHQLKTRKINSPADVYLMTVDDSGRIYYSVMESAR